MAISPSDFAAIVTIGATFGAGLTACFVGLPLRRKVKDLMEQKEFLYREVGRKQEDATWVRNENFDLTKQVNNLRIDIKHLNLRYDQLKKVYEERLNKYRKGDIMSVSFKYNSCGFTETYTVCVGLNVVNSKVVRISVREDDIKLYVTEYTESGKVQMTEFLKDLILSEITYTYLSPSEE